MANAGISINLMNEYSRQLKNKRLLFTKVQFYAGGILVVYLSGLVAVLAYRGILALRMNQVQKTIETTETRITQLKPLETKYYYIQNKLTLIRDFWDQRVDVRSILAHVGTIIPEMVAVNNIAYVESSSTVEMTTSTKDVFVAIEWLNRMEQEVKQNAYDKIAISGLTRATDGTYNLTISFSVPRG